MTMKEMFEMHHEESSEIVEISEDRILESVEGETIQSLKSWEWIFAKGPKFELHLGNDNPLLIEEGRVASSSNEAIVGEKLTNRLLLRLTK